MRDDFVLDDGNHVVAEEAHLWSLYAAMYTNMSYAERLEYFLMTA